MEDTKTGSKKALIFGLLILLMVGYIVYNKQVEEPFSADVSVDTQEVTDETLPSYIVVEELDSGDKLVKHVRDGYEVVVGEEWFVEPLEDITRLSNIKDRVLSSGVQGDGCDIVLQKTDIKDLDEYAKTVAEDEGATYLLTKEGQVESLVFEGDFLETGDELLYYRRTGKDAYLGIGIVCKNKTDYLFVKDEIIKKTLK